MIALSSDACWDYYNVIKDNPCDTVTGKYLFFSSSKAALVDIALSELQMSGFFHAKISKDKMDGDHVLCLYYRDDSRKKELADRYLSLYPIVKYRYWKSDADTHAGKYSKQFKEAMETKERKTVMLW